MSDKLNEILDLVPDAGAKELTYVPKEIKEVVDSGDDYETVRTNILKIIKKGQSALDDLVNMAEQSQHPRMYEAVTSHITSLVAANKALLEITRTQQQIDNADGESEVNNVKTINNNLFVGSTEELQEMIKKLR